MKADYFVYTGNSYPHKNVSRLIDAVIMAKVNLKIISSRSVFVERLEKEIEAKGAKKQIEILGFVPDEKFRNIYKNSVAFVYPTLDEGFGLPPKEAIMNGTFAVVSNIPVLKEVYEDTVMYFDPYDVESIANTLEKVLKMSKAEKDKRIKYAQNFLKRYSWKKMAEETVKIYESVVEYSK